MSEKRAYKRNQLYEAGFPVADYDFPEHEGSFIGNLTMKKWGASNQNLICYFDADDGKKYKLCLWFKYDKEKSYTVTGFCFADVPLDTEWLIMFKKNKKGRVAWVGAYPVNGDADA